jgi:hypothetical protein
MQYVPKSTFLRLSLKTSSLRILAPSMTSTERDLIGIFPTWKSGTSANGASVCWLTTAGPSREMFHRRHTAENQPQLLFR